MNQIPYKKIGMNGTLNLGGSLASSRLNPIKTKVY